MPIPRGRCGGSARLCRWPGGGGAVDGCPAAVVGPAQATGAQDPLNRRRCQTGFVDDVVGTSTVLASHVHPFSVCVWTSRSVTGAAVMIGPEGRRGPRRGIGPATCRRFGIDLESVCGGLTGPAPVEDTAVHAGATSRSQQCVRVLTPNVGHEPSEVWS